MTEAERRWPDWQGGMAIELPDGQTWWFCTPEARIDHGQPLWSFGPDTPHDLNVGLSAALRRILRKWQRAAGDEDRASVLLEAGWFLLARNYRITPEEFEALMAGAAGQTPEQHEPFVSSLLTLVGGTCTRLMVLMESEAARG